MSTIKANRWAWILAGTALAGGGLVLAFLLVMATQNSERLEPYFQWLVWGNLAVAAVLGLTIAIALGRLALRLRARKFGSRLLLKLAGIFGLVGLLPGLLIYTVSYQFVSRSIESWFDVRVEGALEAGLNLGRSTLDTLAQDVAAKTRTAALRLAEEPRTSAQPGLLELERLREQLGARTASVASESGLVVMTAGGNSTRLLTTERLPSTWRSDARNRGVYAQIEGLEDQAELQIFEIADTAVNQFTRARAGARREIIHLDQGDLHAPTGGITRNSGAGDPATDDGQVELGLAHCLQRFFTGVRRKIFAH